MARLPQTAKIQSKPKLDKAVRQQIAEYLLAGYAPDQIVQTLIGQGFGQSIARSEVNKAATSPYLNAGKRYVERAKKRSWFLDIQAKLWRMQPHSKGILELDADQLTPQIFFSHHYATNTPLLVKNMVSHWPAMQRWNLDYFEEKLGDAKIEVQFDRDTNARYEIDSVSHKKVMHFREYIALLRKGEETNNYYLTANNGSTNAKALAPLWDDIIQLDDYLQPEKTPGYLWIGPKGTLTPFHHDLTNNFLVQISGRKQVVLAPGFEVDRMRNSQHCFSDWSVDIEGAANAEVGRRPGMVECVLEPGDVLFLPVGWWHYVKGLDMTFGMSFTNFVVDNDFYSNYSTYHGV